MRSTNYNCFVFAQNQPCHLWNFSNTTGRIHISIYGAEGCHISQLFRNRLQYESWSFGGIWRSV